MYEVKLIEALNCSIVNIEDGSKNIPDGVSVINAPKIWDKGKRGEGVRIAIIDTGCDVDHPDLEDRIIEVRNFTDDDNGDPTCVNDYIGHGTHVAGIIAASGKNITGVAPKSNLIIIKALSHNGGKYSWIIDAVKYAIQRQADIISMSLGGHYDDPELHEEIKRAINKNILVVCAVGNNGDGNVKTNEYNYPAAYQEVISVGSVSADKKSSSFSAYNEYVDLVAPGEGYQGGGIYSTYPGGKYAYSSGTSMAAPHVTGALALLINWSKSEWGRDLSECEMYGQLIKHTTSIGCPKSVEGNGILDLDK